MNLRRVVLTAGILCLGCPGVATTQGGSQATLRMSWDTCDPQNVDMLFTAMATYRMVLSAANFTPGPTADDLIATEIALIVDPVGSSRFPDAWRFDDPAGCQGYSRASYSTSRLRLDCPALRGMYSAPFTLHDYVFDQSGDLVRLLLVTEYDPTDPARPIAGARHVLWQIRFDMTHAVAGPGAPGVTCGGAETPLRVTRERALLYTLGGETAAFQTEPGDVEYVTWNMGPPVQAVTATWGRLKELYR